MSHPHSPTIAIVGGGIAGLAAAHFLKKKRPDISFILFEKEFITGGKMKTSQREGFTFDWGPNGFLTNVPETVELAHALGLEQVLQSASDTAKYRFIYKDGGLRPLPTSPPKFLTSSLLSPLGKLRAGLELIQGKATNKEETVYTFLERHFGSEVASVFANVAVSGITAGDAKQLSVDALFPRFRQLESQHGSLIKGLIIAQRQAKQSQKTAGRLTSFKEGGIGRLIVALEQNLDAYLRRNVTVIALSKESEGYTLTLSSGETFHADKVILATPSYVTGDLLESLQSEVSQILKSIPYADVSVFGLGYDRIDVPHALDGFGFLVPRGEGVKSLGVLWSSSLFPDRAPEGKVMLRVICGGVLEPNFINLPEAEATEQVRRDLRLTMGITVEPEFYEYVRWPKGIPQYLLGHKQKVERARALLPKNLFLIGNAYDGVGVNDAVRSARAGVERFVGGIALEK